MRYLALTLATLILITGCGEPDEDTTDEQVREVIIIQPQFPISEDGAIRLEPGEKPNDNTQRKQNIPHKPKPRHLAGIIAFASNGEIFTMRPDGSNKQNLTKHKADDNNPVWSPDSSKIAFLSSRLGAHYGLFMMQTDGRNPQRVTNWAAQGELNFRPCWSQNGVHIDIEGFSATTPAWSPDFTQIAFAHTNLHVIMILDVATKETVTITNIRSNRPAWSPDGQRIAYQSREGPNDTDPWEIYVINVDGTGNTNLSRNPEGDDQSPTWSPDGRHIAFASNRAPDFNWEIYIMDADGNNQVNITRDGLADDTQPSWK